jgi:hypothetical protein
MAAGNNTSKRGFASMSPETQREIASKGGKNRALASNAGRKGGQMSGTSRHWCVQRAVLLRRLAVERFLADPALLFEERVACPVISFSIAFCWRRISAVQKPRAAPAEALAALSHMLIQGFFIAFLAKVRERRVLGTVPGGYLTEPRLASCGWW